MTEELWTSIRHALQKSTKRGAVLISLALPSSIFVHPVALGRAANTAPSQPCLASLRGTPALDRNGQVRFELNRFSDTPSVIVAVDPADLDDTSKLCKAEKSEKGALQNDVVLNLKLSSLVETRNSDERRLLVAFNGMGPGVFEQNMKMFKFEGMSVGKRHGLTYQPTVGVFYWGRSPGRKDLQVSCIEGDSPTGTCMMSVQARKNVVISAFIVRDQLENWRRYAQGLEKYFNERIER